MTNQEFWKHRKTQTFSVDICSDHMSKTTMGILTRVGLPIISSNYHEFHPLEYISYIEHRYLILGYPFLANGSKENVIVFDCVSEKVFWYSKLFFNIGFVPHIITKVNSDLTSFLCYQQHLIEYTELFATDKNGLQAKKIISAFTELIKKFKRIDDFGLGKEADYQLLWRKRLSDLQNDIEERYEKLVMVDTILFE